MESTNHMNDATEEMRRLVRTMDRVMKLPETNWPAQIFRFVQSRLRLVQRG